MNGEIAFEPLPSDDPKKRRTEISKAERVLGEPRVELEDGLRETMGILRHCSFLNVNRYFIVYKNSFLPDGDDAEV